MAGPGGVEVGRVSVRVVPDTSRFREDLSRSLREAENSLRVQVRADLDFNAQRQVREIQARVRAAGAVRLRVEADTSDVTDSIRRVRTEAAAVNMSGLNAAGSNAGKIAGIASALLVAASAATEIAPAIALAVPAAAALGVGIGVAMTAFQGLMSTAGYNPNNPMIRASKDVAKLQTNIQAVAQDGLPQLIAGLESRYVAEFGTTLLDTGAALNGVVKQMISLGNETRTIDNLRTMFDGARDSLVSIGTAFAPFTQSLIEIGAAATPAFGELSKKIAQAAFVWRDWIDGLAKTGRLEAAISTATSMAGRFVSEVFAIAQGLWDILSKLAPLANTVFSAIGTLANNAVGALRSVIGTLTSNDIGARAFSASVGQILTDVVSIPGRIGQAFAPLLNSDMFRSFLRSFNDAVSNIADLVSSLVQIIQDFASAVADMIGPAILAAFKLVVDAIGAVAKALTNHPELIAAVAGAYALTLTPAIVSAGQSIYLLSLYALDAARAFLAQTIPAIARFAAALAAVAWQAFLAGMMAFKNWANEMALVTPGLSRSIGGLRAAFQALTGAVTESGVAALSFETVMTGGVILAIAAVAAVVLAANHAYDEGKKSVDSLKASFDAMDTRKAVIQIQRLKDQVSDAEKKLAEGTRTDSTTSSLGILAQLRLKGEISEGKKVAAEWQDTLKAVRTNLREVSKETGVSVSALRGLAEKNGIDMGQFGAAGKQAMAELKAAAEQAASEIGLTGAAAERAFGSEWPRIIESVKKDIEDVSKALASDQSVFAKIDPKATAKQQADAAKRVSDATEKLAQVKKDAGKHWTDAEKKQIASAEKSVAAAKKEQGAVKSVQEQIVQGYKDTVAQTKKQNELAFKAMQMGLDPAALLDILKQGPEKASAILQEMTGKHGKALIKEVNDTNKALQKLNADALELTRITSIAANGKTDWFSKNAAKAYELGVLIKKNGEITRQQIEKTLGVSDTELSKLAQEFGITLPSKVQAALNQTNTNIPVTATVTATIASIRMSPKAGATKVHVGTDGSYISGAKTGGHIRGAGTPTSDSILMRLSDGEFVQPYKSVSMYGVDVMEALRRGIVDPTALRALVEGRQAQAPSGRVARPAPAIKATAAPAPATERNVYIIDQNGTILQQHTILNKRAAKSRMAQKRQARLGPERWLTA